MQLIYFLLYFRRLLHIKLYSFGKSFKRLRKQKNLTQESFCPAFKEKTGISVTVTTVRNWEQGRSIPHLNDLIQLAAFFDVSVDYLLGLSDCTSVDNSYINKKTGLNDEAIRALEGAVRESEIEKELYNLRNNKSLTVSETLNIMFKHGILVDIAKSFRNYLLTEYSDSDFSRLNHKEINNMCDAFGVDHFPDSYIMHLARNPEHPNDNISFTLSEKFLESVAIQQIESYLQVLKQLYKEETEV